MIYLSRFAWTPFGTFGKLECDGFGCFTVEREWLDNKPWVSCIPVGRYALQDRRYNRGGYDTYEVCDVPGRSAILIHKGNVSTDVQGCIAVGMSLGCVNGKWAVLQSGVALAALLEAIEQEDELAIEIRDTAR